MFFKLSSISSKCRLKFLKPWQPSPLVQLSWYSWHIWRTLYSLGLWQRNDGDSQCTRLHWDSVKEIQKTLSWRDNGDIAFIYFLENLNRSLPLFKRLGIESFSLWKTFPSISIVEVHCVRKIYMEYMQEHYDHQSPPSK